VASSRNHCSLDGYVRQMALDNIFTSIVAGDDVEHVKPAPDMVWRALKEMNGEIEEALVVGDMTFDVDMAHNAGCKACAVT
jgi:HAD superfamily hydrolase (TIGR01509 family)